MYHLCAVASSFVYRQWWHYVLYIVFLYDILYDVYYILHIIAVNYILCIVYCIYYILCIMSYEWNYKRILPSIFCILYIIYHTLYIIYHTLYIITVNHMLCIVYYHITYYKNPEYMIYNIFGMQVMMRRQLKLCGRA